MFAAFYTVRCLDRDLTTVAVAPTSRHPAWHSRTFPLKLAGTRKTPNTQKACVRTQTSRPSVSAFHIDVEFLILPLSTKISRSQTG